jgi:hypothetical protein
MGWLRNGWSPLACGRADRSSWTEARPTFCVPAPGAAVTAFRGTVPAGLKIPPRLLAACGIEITFSREGRAGSRIIRMRATWENTVSTISAVSSWGQWIRVITGRAACDDSTQSDLTGLEGTCSPGHVSVTGAYDADGADAKRGVSGVVGGLRAACSRPMGTYQELGMIRGPSRRQGGG